MSAECRNNDDNDQIIANLQSNCMQASSENLAITIFEPCQAI